MLIINNTGLDKFDQGERLSYKKKRESMELVGEAPTFRLGQKRSP